VTTDPFDTLGLEPTFDLDAALIDRRVRELGRALHPDRHATATAGQRRQALGRSIDVNEAGRLLRDPIRRAEALRERLLGAAFEALDEAVPGKVPPELLLQMMELRESLAAARQAEDLVRVRTLASPVRQREEAVLAAIDERFAHALGGGQLDLMALDAELGELRYVRRFLDEVAAIEDEFG
jgi:molecular chaperone HscB